MANQNISYFIVENNKHVKIDHSILLFLTLYVSFARPNT